MYNAETTDARAVPEPGDHRGSTAVGNAKGRRDLDGRLPSPTWTRVQAGDGGGPAAGRRSAGERAPRRCGVYALSSHTRCMSMRPAGIIWKPFTYLWKTFFSFRCSMTATGASSTMSRTASS